jgi:toxin ParE1/3/4
MRRFRYSERADADMVGIGRFSIERFGEAQTEKSLKDIEAAIERAVETPSLMRRRAELGADIYSVRCASHVAFMQKVGPDWFVVAVLHGRMDPERNLTPPE